MSTSAEDLRVIALAEFATAGYVGTSLHRIADLAGLSKSSVLYHFTSKEVLLGAAIGPAVDAMGDILGRLEAEPLTAARRREFIVHFVDFLLEHRLEVHMFINQGPSLVDVPVFERGQRPRAPARPVFLDHDDLHGGPDALWRCPWRSRVHARGESKLRHRARSHR